MWPHADRGGPRRARPWLVLGVLAGLCMAAPAQSIGDYSRAQRRWLEASMAENAQKTAALSVAGPAASAPGRPGGHDPAPSAGPSGVLAATPNSVGTTAAPGPSHAAMPAVQALGVFVHASRAVAEIAVDGQPQWLTEGQALRGTIWQVAEISAERVRLERAAGSGSPGGRSTPAAGAPTEPGRSSGDLPARLILPLPGVR